MATLRLKIGKELAVFTMNGQVTFPLKFVESAPQGGIMAQVGSLTRTAVHSLDAPADKSTLREILAGKKTFDLHTAIKCPEAILTKFMAFFAMAASGDTEPPGWAGPPDTEDPDCAFTLHRGVFFTNTLKTAFVSFTTDALYQPSSVGSLTLSMKESTLKKKIYVVNTKLPSTKIRSCTKIDCEDFTLCFKVADFIKDTQKPGSMGRALRVALAASTGAVFDPSDVAIIATIPPSHEGKDLRIAMHGVLHVGLTSLQLFSEMVTLTLLVTASSLSLSSKGLKALASFTAHHTRFGPRGVETPKTN